jgi:hypothetical protein
MSASFAASSQPGLRISFGPAIHTVFIPTALPNSMSESESPIMALEPGVMSVNFADACSYKPGSGFLQSHEFLSCGQ